MLKKLDICSSHPVVHDHAFAFVMVDLVDLQLDLPLLQRTLIENISLV
jgi:hypothetical protein